MNNFKLGNKFNEQLDEVAMENPLRLIIANYYMMTLRETSLSLLKKHMVSLSVA